MLSPDNARDAALTLAEEFVTNPGNFVTEHDLQFRLMNCLMAELPPWPNRPPLRPTVSALPSRSYKRDYVAAVQTGYDHATRGVDPIHAEVSLEKGQRFDVGVFNRALHTVQWDDGSKKFDPDALDALFELKFVKNWKKIDTETGFTPSTEGHGLSDDELLGKFDWGTVGVRKDIEALGEWPGIASRWVILASNFNYLYYNHTEREDEHNSLYPRMGRVAREHLAEIGEENGVNVLYACPRGRVSGTRRTYGGAQWVHDSERGEALVDCSW